jgi:hypothetical protein
MEELCSWIKGSGVRIYKLLIGPSPGHARWADRLEEVVGQLKVAMARWCWANSKIEALRAFS